MRGSLLYKQVFKTLDGAQKRAAFENAHRRDGSRGNVNYRFAVVRCLASGAVDDKLFDSNYDGSSTQIRGGTVLSDHYRVKKRKPFEASWWRIGVANQSWAAAATMDILDEDANVIETITESAVLSYEAGEAWAMREAAKRGIEPAYVYYDEDSTQAFERC